MPLVNWTFRMREIGGSAYIRSDDVIELLRDMGNDCSCAEDRDLANLRAKELREAIIQMAN
jgi:hypothetical protein